MTETVQSEQGKTLKPQSSTGILNECFHLSGLCSIISSVYLGRQVYQFISKNEDNQLDFPNSAYLQTSGVDK